MGAVWVTWVGGLARVTHTASWGYGVPVAVFSVVAVVRLPVGS